MALLKIKPAAWPKDATHLGYSGEVIKDLGEFFPYNPNRPNAKKEPTEIYYVWHYGVWVIKFGRHNSTVVLGEQHASN